MKAEKIKDALFWAVLAVVAALVVGTPVWLLFPRSMEGLVDTSAPLAVSIKRPDGNAELTVQPGTPEMEALEAVLKGHTYHLHWTALFGSTAAQSYVSDTYRILYDDFSLSGGGTVGYRFGGELTWFKKLGQGSSRKGDRVLLLNRLEGTALRQELVEALDIH